MLDGTRGRALFVGGRSHGLLIAAFILSLGVVPAQAQDTNLSIYQRLAVECLGELPSDIDTLALEVSTRMPYLRTALIDRWKSAGIEVYSVESAPPDAAHLPRLAFTVDDASVLYAPAERRRLSRSIRLGLQYSLTGPDGRIILDERCSQAAEDVVDRMAIEQIEDEAFAETQGDLPRAGWLRRIVEPAVITVATAIGVYLFFTLRSQSAEDG